MTTNDLDNEVYTAVQDSRLRRIVEEALMEDIGMGDLTTQAILSPERTGSAEILAKEAGVVAGLEVAALVFYTIDVDVQFRRLARDGSSVQTGMVIVQLDGSVTSMLKAERTALNILQRMSGIATLTRKFVEAVEGTSAKITDTRKTAPGLRILDKLAVRIGGGTNHRFGLDDMVLIKDNHIAAAGSLTAAVRQCLKYFEGKNSMPNIEVETTTVQQVKEALSLKGIDRIMLDNFSIKSMREAVRIINHVVEVEASGNVSLATVRTIAETGVDVISVGALTHSPKALDFSLEIKIRN